MTNQSKLRKVKILPSHTDFPATARFSIPFRVNILTFSFPDLQFSTLLFRNIVDFTYFIYTVLNPKYLPTSLAPSLLPSFLFFLLIFIMMRFQFNLKLLSYSPTTQTIVQIKNPCSEIITLNINV